MVPDPQKVDLEHADTHELLKAAEAAVTEGSLVLERLRNATRQYRERAGLEGRNR